MQDGGRERIEAQLVSVADVPSAGGFLPVADPFMEGDLVQTILEDDGLGLF